MPCLMTAEQNKLHVSEYSLLQYAGSNQRPQVLSAQASYADVAGRWLEVMSLWQVYQPLTVWFCFFIKLTASDLQVGFFF